MFYFSVCRYTLCIYFCDRLVNVDLVASCITMQTEFPHVSNTQVDEVGASKSVVDKDTSSVALKLPRHLECPVDNVFLDVTKLTMPFLRATHHTPNMITTYALFSTIASLYFLNKYDIKKFLVLFNLGYLFDCMDGYYARKYKMSSKYGDLYEHARDNLGSIATIGFVYKLYKPIPLWSWITLGGLIYGNALHIGVQQKYLLETGVKRDMTESIDKLIHLVPKKAKASKLARYTRWFGPGTSVIGSTLLLAFLHYKKRGSLN